MGKKKKKFKIKVNPEKSNKMIIAVAIGLGIVVAAFFIFMILGSSDSITPENKAQFMESTLKYLKATDGIAAVNIYPDQNKVVIIYESHKESKHNFPKVAQFAGLKLSYKMGDEELTVVLSKVSKDKKEEQAVRSYTVKGGRILMERILSTSASDGSE